MNIKTRVAALAAALFLTVALAFGWAGLAGAATATTAVSSNWSGYAVTGSTYKSVSATWTQPTATSTTSSSTAASAFWVGLGGDTSTSNALEQVGTEADVNANGTVSYNAWYELVPSASVKIPLTISAGDTISASVTVTGTKVTVKITNVTTGKTFTKTLTMADPDVTSAEWIAEAPSVVTRGGTEVLPLTDFGTVKFTNAVATTTSGVTGSISYSGWKTQRIRLVTSSNLGFGGFGPDQRVVEVTPTALDSEGSGFSLSWKQLSTSSATTVPSSPSGPGGGFGPGV